MRTLVLCNGGLKSAFLLGLAKREDDEPPLAVFYTHPDIVPDLRSSQAVEALGEYYKCSHMYLTLTNPKPFTFYDIFHMLVHTLALARKTECYRVLLGWSQDNWRACAHLYDKSTIAAFISNIGQTFSLIQNVYDPEYPLTRIAEIEIEVPFYRLTDGQVIFLGTEYFTPWHLTYNCEQNNKLHCGMCDRCHLRQLTFKAANRVDPTEYKVNERIQND